MVILGGLELVAAGYLLHKHQQNKRDKARLDHEAASLSESQYPIFPDERPSRPEHRRRRSRSSSRRRRSRRPHSVANDGKHRRESPRPALKPILKPGINYSNAEIAMAQQQEQQGYRPPPYNASVPPAPYPQQFQSQGQAQMYPQDIKYGWVDDHPSQQVQRPVQDPYAPPTGWPAEWQNSASGSGSQGQRGESSRGREDRMRDDGSRARISRPRRRADSLSPPPSYRA